MTGATTSILETRSFLADAASTEGIVVAFGRHRFDPPGLIGDPPYRSPWVTAVP